MKSSDAFFTRPNNRFCWGDCESIHDGCDGAIQPVLVFSDQNQRLLDTGEAGIPFFYCQEAIKRDRKTGYRVEIVEVSK